MKGGPGSRGRTTGRAALPVSAGSTWENQQVGEAPSPFKAVRGPASGPLPIRPTANRLGVPRGRPLGCPPRAAAAPGPNQEPAPSFRAALRCHLEQAAPTQPWASNDGGHGPSREDARHGEATAGVLSGFKQYRKEPLAGGRAGLMQRAPLGYRHRGGRRSRRTLPGSFKYL